MTTPETNLKKRTFKSFAIFFVAALAIITLITHLSPNPEEEEYISPVFRKVLEFNGKIWHAVYSPERTQTPPPPPIGKKPRLNGDIGLRTPLSLADWSLEVNADSDHPQSRKFKIRMEDIQKLPRTETTAEFKCIEGWSEIISYTGVRFSEFLKHYQLGALSEKGWENGKFPENRFLYVGLETPDGEYYVSLDMESMLHPQTILAYEMNGKPLSEANGAPLRLVIPVKYGIKSLKRIGKIYFSNQRPPDYWAEQGYDWFSGL